MTLLANSGNFETTSFLTSKATISVNTPQFSVTLEARPIGSDADNAPSHELWGPDARGIDIQWGVLFPKQSKKSNLYFNIFIEGWEWRANLVNDNSQDDETAVTILPWNRKKQNG